MNGNTDRELAAQLRNGYRGMDAWELAATELVIEAWHWLSNPEFTADCIVSDGWTAAVQWDRARRFIDAGPAASPSEVEVLRFACDLAADRWHLTYIDRRTKQQMQSALSRALGFTRA